MPAADGRTAELRRLFSARLEESGLTAADAKRLGLEALDARRTSALGAEFLEQPSLRIPYFDAAGRATRFFRVRYLGQFSGLAGQVAKPRRYVQPAGTDPEVYLPPLAPWEKVRSSADLPLYFTEGEFKAAKACREGLATVGLGGVYSWKSQKKGLPMLPVLEGFAWRERPVYMVFDSDFSTNPMVMRALCELSKALGARGARPHLVALPDPGDGTKVGLDDFLVAKGRKAFDGLVEDAVPFSQTEQLWALNSEVVYIRDPGLVVVLEDGRRMSPSAFKEHAYSNRFYYETQFDKDGNSKLTKRPVAPAWLAWEQRAELPRTTYSPGEGRVTASGELNYWPGWGCEPKAGDARPWAELLDFLFRSAPAEARRWFERWCAYPLQHPGAKLYTAAVMWGVAQGTGKSLVGYSLMAIYGRNATEITDEQLDNGYNEWAENKQFVMGDDVAGAEHRRRNAERLKSMVTRRELRVNPKYIPSYVVPDRINYYFTSQHPDALYVEDLDRRYFVHEAPAVPLPREFYRRYDEWLRSGGASALFHHLLRVPLGDFDPKAPALDTPAKRAMVADGRSDLGAWAARLRDDPAGVLRLGDVELRGDLFTNEQLLRLYDPEGRGRVTANGMGRELKKAGIRQVNGGAVVMTPRGPQRLYAVRNCDRWLGANARELARHYEESRAPAEAGRRKHAQE